MQQSYNTNTDLINLCPDVGYKYIQIDHGICIMALIFFIPPPLPVADIKVGIMEQLKYSVLMK